MYKADTFLKLYFTVVWHSLNRLKICDQGLKNGSYGYSIFKSEVTVFHYSH